MTLLTLTFSDSDIRVCIIPSKQQQSQGGSRGREAASCLLALFLNCLAAMEISKAELPRGTAFIPTHVVL